MKAGLTGAQGAQKVLLSPLRLFAAILVSSLMLGGVSAQGNSTATSNAATSGLQNGLKQEVQLEGELEITYQDAKDGHHRLSYSLKQANGSRVPLHFTKEPPTHLLTGAQVRVNGQMSGGSLILYSGNSNVKQGGGGGGTTTSGDATGSSTSSIPVPYTLGAQSTLVVLVNFQDDVVQPYTTSDAYNMFFGTANNFFMENSYGQTSLTGDVVGWYTIPSSVTTCDITQIATYGKNAATAAGVNLSAYTRYVYAFPQDNACGFAGSSDVGGNPSESWINGTTGQGGKILDIQIITHELGHAFGLWHSHLLNCGTVATICSGGTVVEYGDPMDTMGTPQTPAADYNAFQKERLGWLNYGSSPAIQTVTSSGTYTINPYELSGVGPKGLKIFKGNDPTTGAKMWYYLEARQAIGFDSFLTDPFYYNENVTTGVLFHVGTDGDSNSSDLLDMTPATQPDGSWFDPSLAVGQSFQDSTAGVTFATTAVNSGGATVQITVNGTNGSGSSCTAANPSVSVTPSQSQFVTSGTPVNFTVSVKDNDSSSCPAATFNLSDPLPSGWSGVWNAPALSLSPGKTGSATLTVTSPTGTADGSYSVSVSATNSSAGSYGASGAATYVINTAPLSVSLTTNQPSYLPGQTVGITVTMFNGTLPNMGASVTVTVVAPSGRSTTLSGTTGSNGVAILNYNLSRHATTGTYQAQIGAVRTGASATIGASTTFTVQ
jgi:M6 family metalloprotease-like protein